MIITEVSALTGWLKCVHAKSLSPTLCDPMDCSPLGSSVLGIFQARIPEWVALLQGIFPTQELNL